MRATRLKELLDREQVKYLSIAHSPAYTAQEIAASAHISGREIAKTVIVKLDDRLAMAVLPATGQVDLDRLRDLAGASGARLAREDEFKLQFPECETGAMPPFGNLYGMEVWAERALATQERIAFNAGSHAELIQMAYADFERLVQPRPAEFMIAAVPA